MPTPRVSARVRRTSPRQGPRAPLHLVERMQVAAIGMVNAYTDRLMRALGPLLEERFGQRQDAASVRMDRVALGEVFDRVAEGQLTQPFLERMFHVVDRQAADDLQRVVPVKLSDVLPNAAELQDGWVARNTQLIRLEERAQQEVARILDGPLREGVRVEEIRQRIEERLGVVRSRAELIARDQTLKLYGQVQEERQAAAGIAEYTWSGSLDERERPDHLALEGTTQRWDAPPVVDKKTGRREHPGGDFQCRCAAIPILTGDEPPPESETRPSRLPRGEPANDVPELPETPALAAPEAIVGGPPEPPPPSGPPSSGPPSSGPPSSQPPSEPPLLATHAEYAAHLESRGFEPVSEETFHSARAVMGDLTASELDAVMGWDALGEIQGPRTASLRATWASARFGVTIQQPIGTAPVELFRTFQKKAGELVVHHDLLRLPEALQGAGIGKRLIAAQVLAYERIGVSRIDLDAAWIGRYYWPKLGFSCPPADLRRYQAEFVVFLRGAGLDPAAIPLMTHDIKTIRDIAITEVGDRKLGKEFLLSHARMIPNLKMSLRPGSKQLAILKRELGL